MKQLFESIKGIFGQKSPATQPEPEPQAQDVKEGLPTASFYNSLPRRHRMRLLRRFQKQVGLDYHPGEPYWLYEGLDKGRVGDISLKFKNRKAARQALIEAHRA